jgi:hypothetical protein
VDRRFLLFLVLSFLVLTANSLWVSRQEQARRARQEAAAPKAPAEDEREPAADGDGPPDAAAAPAADEEPAPEDDEPAGAEPEPAVPLEYVTLGSVDPASAYRMGVIITNQGAGVRRLELSSPKYLDVHDRGGYLGHLELADDGGGGLLVQAVVAGTPAAKAGLRAGDRLVGAGIKDPAPLAKAADLTELLESTKPKQELQLAVERGDEKLTLSATLRERAPAGTEAAGWFHRAAVVPAYVAGDRRQVDDGRWRRARGRRPARR